MKPWSVYLRKAVGKMGWPAGPWNTGALTAFQGMDSSVRPSHSCPSTSSPFSFYSSWLVGFSSLILFVSSFIKNQANPGGNFQDLLSRIWCRGTPPLPCPSSSVVPPSLPYVGPELLAALFVPISPEASFDHTRVRRRKISGDKDRDISIVLRAEGAGEGCGQEERIPQRRKVGLFYLEIKMAGWLGQIHLLGVFILLLALCHGISSWLLCYLFIYFWNIQNGKKMPKKKYEMVGVRKKCQGIFFFLFSGYLLIQHLRKSAGQPTFWGSLPR